MIITGVGSRNISEQGIRRIREAAVILNEWGATLRSGGAEGADTVFESMFIKKEIYLPWKDFNGNNSPLYGVSKEAMEIAKEIHPNFAVLSEGAKKLHARNVYQVLGKDLNTPSNVLICWTADGANSAKTCSKTTGGTATAIRLADKYGIKIYNLGNNKDYDMCMKILYGMSVPDLELKMPEELKRSIIEKTQKQKDTKYDMGL